MSRGLLDGQIALREKPRCWQRRKGVKEKKISVNIGTLFEDNKCVCQTANLSIGL